MARCMVFSGERHSVGGGAFYFGHSERMASRLAERYGEGVQLVYLDPPFGTGSSFTTGARSSQPGTAAYEDTLSLDGWLALLRPVLQCCRKLLAPSGAIYLHVDYRMGAYARLLMDKVFGADNFVNEIIWAYKSGGRAKNHFSRKHDTILLYRKSRAMYFNAEAVGIPRGPERRNHMKRAVDEHGKVYFTICSGGRTYTYYEDSLIYPTDVWEDIEHLHQRDPERTGYATQKPLALLSRIILASSAPGDTVADLFSGSGTTAAAASALGRRWIAADSSPVAMAELRSRLLRQNADITLFDDVSDMTLNYVDAPRAEMELDIDAKRMHGGVCATLNRCIAGAPPAYMALGYADGGLFVPLAYDLAPESGSRLFASCTKPPVVQLCGADGNMRFMEYDV